MIPEDLIMKNLKWLLETSEPGAEMHHLHVIAAPKSAMGPLGVVDPEKLETTVYALLYVQDAELSVPQFIAGVFMKAALDHKQEQKTILFAAMSIEVFGVESDDELARKLSRERRLSEHPDVVELTVAYGACRDGRRWRGVRYLTGSRAGQTEDANVLIGPVSSVEENFAGYGWMLRGLVGIGAEVTVR